MLKLDHIKKTFNPGTVNEKAAIRDLSLHLEPGDFATVIGSNGAGKSTMFAAIAGSFITDSGSITLNGKDITFAPEYQRSRVIGRLFQDPLKGTAPHMTIEENLSLAYLRASRGSIPFSRISKKDKEFFREQLSMLDMGLEDRMKQPVGLLSGGQRQALTLLMATMVPPLLLLLDEHTAALGSGHGGKGAGADKKDRGKKSHHLSDGHPQYAAGPDHGKPDADDGRWPDRVRCEGRGAVTHDRAGSSGEVPHRSREGA